MRPLQMDFQPNFMAGHSLQDYDRSHWERKVRPGIVPAQQPKCVVCGFVAKEKRSLIHADEVWSFPRAHKVILVDVRPLCTRCHEAKDYAYLRYLITSGARSKSREDEIRTHYCAINQCSEDEFKKDLKAALALKSEREASYGANCRPDVDYGRWARPEGKPRLSNDEQQLLRRAIETLDVPTRIRGHRFSTYRMAVRTLQSMPLSDRGAMFDEMRVMLDEDQDDDVIAERDDGVQW